MSDQAPHRQAPAAEVRADAARVGTALLADVAGPTDLLDLAEALGTIEPHRDSGPTGVTVIEDRGTTQSGMVAFSRRGLAPHTDRSGVPCPPGLVLAACGHAPAAGGESLLVDGQAVYAELAATNPAACLALSAPRSALFGGADGYLGSVFTRHNGAVSVRLRTDDLARFAPASTPHLTALHEAIGKHTVTNAMSEGSGYVISNSRWLHGRHAFQGHRVVYRVTANAHAGSVPRGFPLGHLAREGAGR